MRAIRAGQAMGMSLGEIKVLAIERRAGGKEWMLQTMIAQRDRLKMRADEIAALRKFVDAKIGWLLGDARGLPPQFTVAARTPAASIEKS